MTITAAKTFYAQFTANSYSVTWDLGDGNTETTKQTYGEALVLPTEPTRKNAELLGWFTDAVGGTQVDANAVYLTEGELTYYPCFGHGHRRTDVPADARKKLSGGAADKRSDLVPGGTAAEKPVVTDGAVDSKNRLHQPQKRGRLHEVYRHTRGR